MDLKVEEHDAPVRTKKQKQGRRAGRGPTKTSEAAVAASQSDLVRTMRVEPKKDLQAEDPTQVLLSRGTGKAPQIQLSDDKLAATGNRGFRTVRASHGTAQGTWYCEATVEHLGPTGHVRLGWCARKAELQAPIGFDKFGYCYRDVEGSKVHQGLREAFGSAYGEGDTVGLLIHLPLGGRGSDLQERPVVRFKGNLYYVDEPEPEPQPLKGSFMAFTLNGKLQGSPYSPLLDGLYFPAASLYTMPDQAAGARVRFNFGPHFKHPPPVLDGCPPAQPVCQLVQPIGSARDGGAGEGAGTGVGLGVASAISGVQKAEPMQH
mmetsp:Transcript_813/g.1213  ORF Transcript_813/g.1213 Transcript_813/m.1213 type:complete len:319 (+) Transcript_813:208-1164(+)